MIGYYIYSFACYRQAPKGMAKRKRKAELKKAILIVEVEHWNKVKDFITKAKKNELILMP